MRLLALIALFPAVAFAQTGVLADQQIAATIIRGTDKPTTPRAIRAPAPRTWRAMEAVAAVGVRIAGQEEPRLSAIWSTYWRPRLRRIANIIGDRSCE